MDTLGDSMLFANYFAIKGSSVTHKKNAEGRVLQSKKVFGFLIAVIAPFANGIVVLSTDCSITWVLINNLSKNQDKWTKTIIGTPTMINTVAGCPKSYNSCVNIHSALSWPNQSDSSPQTIVSQTYTFLDTKINARLKYYTCSQNAFWAA